MKRAFGFIDVQQDFMNINGKLYVSGSESIKEKIVKLVNFAEIYECSIFFTQDLHLNGDPELISAGGIFPDHCMNGTLGANIIDDIILTIIPQTFTKRCYDIFDDKLGSPDRVKNWLKKNNVTEVWLAGVVGNICVEAAANGFRKEGIDVYIIEDAVVWMDLENGIFCKDNDNKEKSIERLKKIGCHFVKFALL